MHQRQHALGLRGNHFRSGFRLTLKWEENQRAGLQLRVRNTMWIRCKCGKETHFLITALKNLQSLKNAKHD